MAIVNEGLTFPSANGKDTVYAQLWHDDGVTQRGIFQIIHGMGEHVGRYEAFARFLAEKGFVACGCDLTGHGRSKGADGYGYFADRNGNRTVVEDVHILNELVKRRYPGLKSILLGHSLGSFICRSYLVRYGEGLKGAVISGTSGPNPLTGVGFFLCRTVKLFRGAKHQSPFLANIQGGSYNKRISGHRTQFDWLTNDTAVVDRYIGDELCGFDFTTSGYLDILKLLREISSRKWAEKIPKGLPCLIFSGSEDPVGNYTKGVKAVYDRMKAAGVKDVTLKIYEGGRHEMLNETVKETVYDDILSWVNRVMA